MGMVISHAPQSSLPRRVAIRSVVPYAHVADVDRSVEFYELLGLACEGTFRDQANRSCWACVGQSPAQLMLALSPRPIVASNQSMLIYIHASDIRGLRHHLLAHGVHDGSDACTVWGQANPRGMVSGVTFPDHMKRGELRVQDPDGYLILIGQTR